MFTVQHKGKARLNAGKSIVHHGKGRVLTKNQEPK